MIVVGVDGHKNTHALVVVDPLGKRLAELTVAARPVGHLKALAWLHGFGPVLVAVEDCRHLTRRFEADLLNSGHAVVRVHRLVAGARRSARERGKSSPIDAEAVARVALREPDLPKACLDGPSRDVKLLIDHPHTLMAQRTAIGYKLCWFLHELDPELAVAYRGLRRLCVLDQPAPHLGEHTGELLADIGGLTSELGLGDLRLCRQCARDGPDLAVSAGAWRSGTYSSAARRDSIRSRLSGP